MADKTDKFGKAADKLVKTLEGLSKATGNVTTVLAGSAFLGAFKSLSVAVPQAATRVVKELGHSVSSLNRTINTGVGQLRKGFQSLFNSLRDVSAGIQRLFASTMVHTTPNQGSALSRSLPLPSKKVMATLIGGLFAPVLVGALVGGGGGGALGGVLATSLLAGVGSAVAIRSSRIRGAKLGTGADQFGNLPADTRKGGEAGVATSQNKLVSMIASRDANSVAILSKLGQINTAIINSANIQSAGQAGIIAKLDRVIEVSAAKMESLREVVSTKLDAILDGDLAKAAESLDHIANFISDLEMEIVGGFETIYGLISTTTHHLDQIGASTGFLEKIHQNIVGCLKDLDIAVSSHSLHVHVKDDPASRAGLTSQTKGQGGPGILGGLMGTLGTVAKIAGGAVGIAGLVGGALSPGMLDQMALAFKDITATIGVAFEPILRVTTGTLRQIAHAIFPLFLKLRPMFEQLAGAFGRLLVPVIKMVSMTFEAMLPFLEPLVNIFDGLSETLTYITTVFVTFADALGEFILGLKSKDFKTQMREIVTAFTVAGQQLVLAVATIAKKLGYTGFVDKLIKHFEEATITKPMGGAVAAGNTSLSNLQSIVKNMNLSAARAGGFGGPSPEEEAKQREQERVRIAQETLDALKEIQKKGESDTLLPQIKDAALTIADFVKWLRDQIQSAKNAPQQGVNAYEGARAGRQTREGTGTFFGEILSDFGAEMGRLRRAFGGT